MCVEVYFLINQAMDFSIIAAVTRRLGCFRLRRALTAATLAALYATLALAFPVLGKPLIQLFLLCPITLLSTGWGPPNLALSASASLVTVTLSSGACAGCAASGFSPAALLLPGIMSLGALPVRSRSTAHLAMIEVLRRNASVRFTACVDTGNRLTEPLSGQPILIASEALIREILPDSGFRQVAYGSVGGGGVMKCFRPDRIYIWKNGRRRRAPDAWIAIYPKRLPGITQALTPAAFAF